MALLKAMMEKLGFARAWIQVVMNMVQSVKFSVLFNGEKLEQCVPTRGIDMEILSLLTFS